MHLYVPKNIVHVPVAASRAWGTGLVLGHETLIGFTMHHVPMAARCFTLAAPHWAGLTRIRPLTLIKAHRDCCTVGGNWMPTSCT